MCGWLPLTHPTRDLACNPGMCPDWELNWRPFGLQAGTQSTEPHQPGHKILKNKNNLQRAFLCVSFVSVTWEVAEVTVMSFVRIH